MPYTRIAVCDPETEQWHGYFAEVGEWAKTSGENGTLAELSAWFDYLLADLQAWEREGVIPPLPVPYEDGWDFKMVLCFNGDGDAG